MSIFIFSMLLVEKQLFKSGKIMQIIISCFSVFFLNPCFQIFFGVLLYFSLKRDFMLELIKYFIIESKYENQPKRSFTTTLQAAPPHTVKVRNCLTKPICSPRAYVIAV